jgi:hypothetical protein
MIPLGYSLNPDATIVMVEEEDERLERKTYRVTWHFKPGASYSIPFVSAPPGGVKMGEWEAPFPADEYDEGYEDFWPIGDMGDNIIGALREMHGHPVRVVVEDWEESPPRERQG